MRTVTRRSQRQRPAGGGGSATPRPAPVVPGPLRARLLGSVRARLALTAMVVVAVTLGAGGATLLFLLHRSLVSGVVTTASAEATDVAAVAGQDRLTASALRSVRPGTVVQILDARGRVLASSTQFRPPRPVLTERPAPGDRWVRVVPGVLPGGDDRDVVVATTVSTGAGPRTVLVVTSTEPVEATVHDLAIVLGAALPVLVVLSGGFAWLLAGRALRPVERIRSEVGRLSAGDLHRRVAVPPGHDEVGRLAVTMNALLDRLEQASDRQRRFVADASHELRSPLAALLAEVEVARAHPSDADWRAVSATVADEGARLARIVEDLLLLARSDEGRLAARRSTVDLDDLVREEARLLRARGTVLVDLRGVAPAQVHADHEQLRRVVRNLADNAERHAATTVAFEVTAAGAWAELAVADDGPGIPRPERRRVFERFARLDEGRGRPTGGAGLGLAIVKDLVAANGGRVFVADSATGARVVVRLPAARDACSEDLADPGGTPVPPPGHPGRPA
ncbi:MAG TPA: ATP-binding protein [Acidimicrobiales bacterium]|nr:ATP-binding protein [Acidimicrobiales bacterium]